MKQTTNLKGFTLTEALVAIAAIGILAAIAIPSYSEYIRQTQRNIAAQKAEHLQLLLQDYWEDNATYVAGDGSMLEKELGWDTGDADITGKVEAGASGIKSSFIITVTHAKVSGQPVVIRYSR